MNPLCCIAPVSLDPRPNPPAPTSLLPCGPDLEALDEDDGDAGGAAGRAVEGLVYKWVNYGKGWRERWMLLRDGVLSYYKLRGPDKIAGVGRAGDGFSGRVVIGEESRKYLRKRGFGSGRGFSQVKPFGEVHLKVSSIRASRSDDKRFSIFTGTKTLHLRCATKEDRTAWIEALLSAKEMFPRVTTNCDPASPEDVAISTEKLRTRLSQEGLPDPVIKECEAIMVSELAELQNQLRSLQYKQLLLLGKLRQLEAEKIELEATVVHETKEHESYCGEA